MIQVEKSLKIRLTEKGANKIFKEDYNDRQKMGEEKLVELFDNIWCSHLENLIETAELITYDEAIIGLSVEQKTYANTRQKHRSFRYEEAQFIVQLQTVNDNDYTLTQLWMVRSSDVYPKTLFINFKTIKDREYFHFLAESLKTSDQELGLQLLYNFINLHPSFEAFDKEE